MKIQINNTPKETQATTLSALIAEAGLPEKGIAAAIDNKMIPKAEVNAAEVAGNEDGVKEAAEACPVGAIQIA